MSSYPYINFSNVFNPNDFLAVDSSLTIAAADQRYIRIGGIGYLSSLTVSGNLDAASISLSGVSIDLSSISGVTAGTATASKALIVDSSRDITNINAISVATLNVSGNAAYTGTNSQVAFSGTNGSVLVSGTNGFMELSGNHGEFRVSGSGAHIHMSGASSLITLSNTTPSTSASTGAIQCAGGAYFGAASIFGGNLDCASLTIGGSSTNLSYLAGITPGTVTASKAIVVDANKDITSFRYLAATRLGNNPNPLFAIDMGATASDRLLAVFENGTAFYGLGANASRLQLHAASGAGIRMYTGSTVSATGTQILDINSAGLLTCDSATLDTVINSPLANIRNNAQVSGNRDEYLSIGRSSSGTDHGAWAFMNYYQTATQGDSNYITFGPRLRTGLTTGWGFCMTQNGNCSFQDKNANGGAGGFKIQANIVGTVDIQGGITRTVGAGHGYLQANSGSPAAYNASSVSTRIGLWVENAIWTGDKVYASSDLRLKRDIEPIPLDEAKKLLNVQAFSYRWKKDTENHMPEIGCIAQDLLEAGLHPLVSFCPNDDKENFPEGYQLGLQYSRLPIYMIELIKDLYEKTNMQQKEINRLSSIVDIISQSPSLKKLLKNANDNETRSDQIWDTK